MKLQDLKTRVKQDNFSKFLGIEIVELSNGHAKTKLKVTKDLLNFFGSGHGAAIYSVADVAFSLACNAQDNIEIAVALNVSINYIQKVNLDDVIFAEANLISSTGRISVTEIIITNQKKELIAKFEGLAYQKRHQKS
ncbi:MAG: PaaI family thioesterase [Candidatus Helarchaeota archaeon]